ncbi:unnamed protein product [Cladocopium goreaui]|uniref:Uncharacterized protein n=1 Tax=Cladocopium goreaui TaxID=2562237 RepID=A0A9P1FZ04_9DINO|nr:unnamed protein product [Cladocopium goreaui]
MALACSATCNHCLWRMQKPNQIRCCWPGPGWLGLDAPSRPKSGRMWCSTLPSSLA